MYLLKTRKKGRGHKRLNVCLYIQELLLLYTIGKRVIPCEIKHSKNESLPIVFILSTESVHSMRVHNPEYHDSCDFWFHSNKMYKFRQLAQTDQPQLDIPFLFIYQWL